jgi:hypothetical protein
MEPVSNLKRSTSSTRFPVPPASPLNPPCHTTPPPPAAGTREDAWRDNIPFGSSAPGRPAKAIPPPDSLASESAG